MQSSSTQLINDERLEKALEKFIKENIPAAKELNDKDLKELVKDTVKMLRDMSAKTGDQLTVGKLTDPKFAQQLTAALMINSTLKGSKELTLQLSKTMGILTGDSTQNNLDPKFKAFMDDYKKLLEQKPDDKALKTGLKALLIKHLDPKQHGALVAGLTALGDKLNKEMKAHDKNDKDNKSEKSIADEKKESLGAPNLKVDPYSTLLGVLNAAIAGGHHVPTPSDFGNGLGIPDLNPNHGSSNLDKADRIDLQLGQISEKDNAIENGLQAAGAMTEILESVMGNDHKSPTPFATEPKPRGAE